MVQQLPTILHQTHFVICYSLFRTWFAVRQYPELCDAIDKSSEEIHKNNNYWNKSETVKTETVFSKNKNKGINQKIISKFKVNTHAFEITKVNGTTVHRFRTDLCQFNTSLKYNFPVQAFRKKELLDLNAY